MEDYQSPNELSRDYIVDQIFPSNEVHIIAGPSGSGKTRMLHQEFIPRLVAGSDVWGHQCRKPRKCVYFSLDRSIASIADTLRQMKLAPAATILSAINDDIPLDIDSMYHIAEQYVPGVEVFIIESFLRLFRVADDKKTMLQPGNINDYLQVSDFLTTLTRKCMQLGITLMCSTHTTKMRERDLIFSPRERLLGSVAWGAYSDTLVYIGPVKLQDEINNNRRLYIMPRNSAPAEFVYQFDQDGRLVETTQDANDSRLDKYLYEEVNDETEFTRQEVDNWAALQDISKQTVTRWLSNLVDAGYLERVVRGRYRKRILLQ
jgi:hypothetical protein